MDWSVNKVNKYFSLLHINTMKAAKRMNKKTIPISYASNPIKIALQLQVEHKVGSIMYFLQYYFTNQQIQTKMRRRSGALHCQSQQDFIQLAQAAQDKIGIFYDPRVNKKIMNHYNTIKQNKTLTSQSKKYNPYIHQQINQLNYYGFQFGLQTNRQKQEREQLQRINLELGHSQIISIISTNVPKTFANLTNNPLAIFPQQNINNHFDLYVVSNNNRTTKYWIIDRQYLREEPLVKLYLQQSHIIMDECQQIKIIKNLTEEDESLLKERFKKTISE